MLIKSTGKDDDAFFCKNIPIISYDPRIHQFFSSISLVSKLHETRALVGFSRLTPNNKPISEKKKLLRKGNAGWIPAIEVTGEGIFIQFRKEALIEWSNKPEVASRIKTLNEHFQKSMFSKSSSAGESLRAEYVLIHTFAHLMINQLSYECGYGSSSIRERIYCGKTTDKFDMYGVLLYTASGDSEGSMGGLVRQGEAGRLEDTVLNAVLNAEWCSSDPVCIQSEGQGPESLNLAACHNCALLPETCCENGNRLLDRGLVVGTLTNKKIGFFSNIGE